MKGSKQFMYFILNVDTEIFVFLIIKGPVEVVKKLEWFVSSLLFVNLYLKPVIVLGVYK